MNSDSQIAATEIKPEAVREQLGRMLAHPVFKASKRCQLLLQYLVEYVLSGETVHPKERTLGVEVFGRAPDYDTNDDPVVRTTSSDIRKRIAQYYHELQHETELRIDMPPGSYLPEFHSVELQATEEPAEKEIAQALVIAPEVRVRKFSPYYIAVFAVVILALCSMGYYWARRPAPLDRFWSPLLDRSETLSVGVPISSLQNLPKSRPAVASTLGMPSIGITDDTALLLVNRFLDSRNARYSVKHLSFSFTTAMSPSEASLVPTLAELRSGPVIFIGNSDWTMRLLSPLRFHIMTDNAADLFWIEDKQNLSAKDWSGKIDQPYNDYTQDYAIISRVFDQTTGQTVVAVSGLGLHGTAAAAEFVTNPVYMGLVAAGNSRDWQKKNLQIVIGTRIAGESWGPPQVLAKYFW